MNQTVTLTDLSRRWLQECQGLLFKETADTYSYLYETLILPYFGEKTEISEQEVKVFLQTKKEAGLADSTLGTLYRILRRTLEYGASLRLCPPPDWSLNLGTPQNKRDIVILTPPEEQQLCAYLIENPSPKHLCMFLILTSGISVGESLALQWKDVSIVNKTLTVCSRRGPLVKRKDRIRKLTLDERQLIYLRKMASLPGNYLCSGTPLPISRANLEMRWRYVLRELCLPQMSLTCLRHTFAVHALEAGADFAGLSTQLGLENGATFRKFYRELSGSASQDPPQQKQRPKREAQATSRAREAARELTDLRQEVEAKKKALQEELDNLEGDLEIIRTLRNADGVQGQAREGLYQFVEKVLGPDDKDGQYLVEYLRCNMRVASMPLRVHQIATVQAIRRRVAHGFEKLCRRMDAINAVEGWDMLGIFQELCRKIAETAPPAPRRTGPKGKPTVKKALQDATEALERIRQALEAQGAGRD